MDPQTTLLLALGLLTAAAVVVSVAGWILFGRDRRARKAAAAATAKHHPEAAEGR